MSNISRRDDLNVKPTKSGIRRLKRNLENTKDALTYKDEEILPIEKVQRDKLKYRKR